MSESEPRCWLAFDGGNTHMTWGLFEADALVATGKLANRDAWNLPLPEWESARIDGVIVGSVNRDSEQKLTDAWSSAHRPRWIVLGSETRVPVEVSVPHPEQVGVDRLLNALAWHDRRSAPAVIVDFGTAITFDLVSVEGVYQGGLILPGPGLIARSLDLGTSLLPRVEIEPTPEVFGRDTLSAIRRGVFGLLRGGVSFHVAELRRHLGRETVFVATGGGAAIYASWFDGVDLVAPYLTLEGLRSAAARLTASGGAGTGRAR